MFEKRRPDEGSLADGFPASDGRMKPLLREGDMLEVDTWAPYLRLGDVVLCPSSNGPVVRRIIAFQADAEEDGRRRTGNGGRRGKNAIRRPPSLDEEADLLLVTKADREPWPEPPLSADQILGRVVAVHTARGPVDLNSRGALCVAWWAAFLSRQQALLWRGFQWAEERLGGRLWRGPRWFVTGFAGLLLCGLLGLWRAARRRAPSERWLYKQRIRPNDNYEYPREPGCQDPIPRQAACAALSSFFMILTGSLALVGLFGASLETLLENQARQNNELAEAYQKAPRISWTEAVPTPSTVPPTWCGGSLTPSRPSPKPGSFQSYQTGLPESSRSVWGTVPSANWVVGRAPQEESGAAPSSSRSTPSLFSPSPTHWVQITQCGSYLRIEADRTVPVQDLESFARAQAQELKRQHGLKRVRVTGYRDGQGQTVLIGPAKD